MSVITLKDLRANKNRWIEVEMGGYQYLLWQADVRSEYVFGKERHTARPRTSKKWHDDSWIVQNANGRYLGVIRYDEYDDTWSNQAFAGAGARPIDLRSTLRMNADLEEAIRDLDRRAR